jgi:kumamolisin
VTVTVSNTAPPPPAACATTSQLLGNPGFETGTAAPWTASAGVIDSSPTPAPHSGTWKAWLDGYGTTHTDTLSQAVTIPAGACSATLSFWLSITTSETTTTTAFDHLTVTVRNAAGAVTTLAAFSNLDRSAGYVQRSFDLSAFKGQAIMLQLQGTEDASLQTSFLVDDAAVTVTQ